MPIVRAFQYWGGPVCAACHDPITRDQAAFDCEDEDGQRFQVHKACSEQLMEDIKPEQVHG